MFRLPRIVLVATGISVLVALIILFDLTPWVRGGYGWRWMIETVPVVRVLPLIAIMGIYVIGAVWLLSRTKRSSLLLIWAILGTAIIATTVAYTRDGDALYALFTRTTSVLSTGPHWASLRIDWAGGEWQDWTAVMGELGGHLGTSPPGLPMLYGVLNDTVNNIPFTDSLHLSLLPLQCHNYDLLQYEPSGWASTWFGILMPLWAALTVIPIYGITRRIFDLDSRLPIYTALWWALIPALGGFTPSWNTIYPLLSAGAFWLLLIGLDSARWRRMAWLFGVGIIAGIALFSHFTFLPLLGMLGFYTLGLYIFIERDSHSFSRPVIAGIPVALGLALPWVLFMLAGGSSPIAVLQASFDYHLDLDRPYWFWSWFHIWDWALWTGLGFAVLWLAGLWHYRRRRDGILPLVGMSLLMTIMVLALSGATQGESGRIWLFLSPFLLVAAMDGLRRIVPPQVTHRAWVIISVSQALLALVLSANLEAIDTEYTRPPDTPIPQITIPTNITFTHSDGNIFRLVGWSAETVRSNTSHDVVLNLAWETNSRLTEPYWFGAFLVPPEGAPSEPVLWQPGEYIDFGDESDDDLRYPSTCWTPSTVVGDTVHLPIPSDTSAGDLWISLAVFGDDSQPEGRIAVILPDGTQDLQVGLGPVRLE